MSTIKCKILGRNLVNQEPKEFEIAEGAVFIENLNETLNSGTIIIPHQTSEIEIEPLDLVHIYGLRMTSRYLLVSSYRCETTSLNPRIYKYTIELESEIKAWEGIPLPSLAITRLKNGTPRSVYDYIEQFINDYGTKLTANSGGVTTAKYSIHSSVRTKFIGVECPEMQWNEPTLREVINDLMMVSDCIPTITNNKLKFIDISTTTGEILNTQKNKINLITKSQSSDDYVSGLKMKLVNSANNSTPSGDYNNIESSNLPKDMSRIIENIGFRNSDDYLLTTENMRLETSFPIWNVFYCEINFKVSGSVTVRNQFAQETNVPLLNQPIKVILKDSTVNYILEKSEWLTKNVYYGSWDILPSLSTNYRNTCLYYTRGQKNIVNFNDKVENQILFIPNARTVFELIIYSPESQQQFTNYAIAYAESIGQTYVTSTIITNPDFKGVSFRLGYEAIDECTFTAEKSTPSRNKRTIIDNQTNSYVDIKRQGALEYLKANRLGNKISLINARYETGDQSIPALAKTIDGEVIFRKETTYNLSYQNVNLYTMANYVMRDYFTGVKSKIRSWKVVSGSEALLRAEHLKFYFNNTLSPINNLVYKLPSQCSIDSIISSLKYCVIQFTTAGGETRPIKPYYAGVEQNLDAIMVEFTNHRVGNSLIYTIRMPDNYYIGTYVSNYSGTNGRVEQKGIAYTDDNGEITGGVICFYMNDPSVDLGDEAKTLALKPYTKIHLNGTAGAMQLALTAQIPFTIHKDNKEILQISIQFELNENANNIFLGKI